jgi:hypothetical protein
MGSSPSTLLVQAEKSNPAAIIFAPKDIIKGQSPEVFSSPWR